MMMMMMMMMMREPPAPAAAAAAAAAAVADAAAPPCFPSPELGTGAGLTIHLHSQQTPDSFLHSQRPPGEPSWT